MGVFERYLSLWISLAILLGLTLGNFFPDTFQQIAAVEYAHVNLVVALLIWAMIYPMMIQVDFASMKQASRQPKGLMLTLVINWLIKPFTMALLGWLFFELVFASWVDPMTAKEYIAGMILLGVAPCTAMVFVWSQLTNGNPSYTLLQVSVNDVIMIFAFAPIAGLLLGISGISVPWETLVLSTVLYVVFPLIAGVLTRRWLLSSSSPHRMTRFLIYCKPWSIVGLLSTVVLLFGFQSEVILTQPLAMAMIAIPLLIQTYGIFFITFWFAKKLQLSYDVAAPACLISTSNFFELAVAVAISLFGLHSGAALATVVGVLVEVPVMLSLVAFTNRSKNSFTIIHSET
ncbi:ACR3 family arsenite efflux transporter [Aliikangiella sp. IMCC44359]|uniref:ACR3 family arsenite efflux transporter n=1 Tax=Aliikangiella sp. IMCC44359 TaxID=3459125 RepID=UPI00403B1F4F